MKEIEELKRDITAQETVLGSLKSRLDALADVPAAIEKGRWHKIKENGGSQNEHRWGFGFNHIGEWTEDYGSPYWDYSRRILPLSESEIKDALVKEWEKRGGKSGATVKRSHDLLEASGNLGATEPFDIECNTLQYYPSGDVLRSDGNTVYCKGLWAEIIKVTIGGYEVKFIQPTGAAYTTIAGHMFNKSFWEACETVALHSKACVKIGCSHQFDLPLETIQKILAKL